MALQSYFDMSLNEVIAYARRTLAAAAEEPPGSPEHAALMSAYESAMGALKHKMYLLNIRLGLRPVVIPDAAVSHLVARQPGR